jgi:hypothetical protein
MRLLMWLVVGALVAPAVSAQTVDLHITTSEIPVFRNQRSGRMTQIIQNQHELRMLQMVLAAAAPALPPTPPAPAPLRGAQPASEAPMHQWVREETAKQRRKVTTDWQAELHRVCPTCPIVEAE